VPLVVVLAPISAQGSGIAGAGPALTGLSLGLLLTGIGVSSVASVLSPYPAPRPGSGPFDQPPVGLSTAGWAQTLSLGAIALLMAPALWLAVWSAWVEPDSLPLAGAAGVVTGTLVLVLGVAVGGRLFSARSPELLDLALRT
jgi:ABC-2 type transport system permease protein